MNTELSIQNDSNSSNTSDLVVCIRNLEKSFGENHVLKNFNFKLYKGESIVVLGKSGSGKSVLVKCIIGLLYPDAGTIQVLGKNIPDLNHDELDRIRVKVGFLFQSNALYDSMTVRENLEFPLRRHWIKMDKEEVNSLVMEALGNVGLEETIDMMPSELSGGMRKRIALARTLILKPETSTEISNLIVDVQKKYNTSSIVISHDMNCVKIVANKIVMLVDGTNYISDTYKELQKSKDIKISSFFK